MNCRRGPRRARISPSYSGLLVIQTWRLDISEQSVLQGWGGPTGQQRPQGGAKELAYQDLHDRNNKQQLEPGDIQDIQDRQDR